MKGDDQREKAETQLVCSGGEGARTVRPYETTTR